ncbi:hypothetical protein KIN20_033489 [Parelaphostrongylus tenuis]|uniref:Uncharacterized protein n=1 Tax=Parelaphostrongylus tenuis TaxID=148309 RepID=A0AAD5WIA9_PARTN|nr:hypothetical protein KIN20_033489 [Parelaphostrongylus tenuis]
MLMVKLALMRTPTVGHGSASLWKNNVTSAITINESKAESFCAIINRAIDTHQSTHTPSRQERRAEYEIYFPSKLQSNRKFVLKTDTVDFAEI